MIDIMKEAAYEGGKILMSHFLQELDIKDKYSHQSIVTQADTESQEVIHQKLLEGMLQSGYSEDQIGFIGEEGLFKKGEVTFVIDPLDGTTNFACGLEDFAIHIGCFVKDELVAGVVYVPCKESMYFAEKGKGAYKEYKGEKTQMIMKNIELKNGLLSAYLSSNPQVRDEILDFVVKIGDHVRGVRVLGGSTFLYLVENNCIIFSGRQYLWDLAGPLMIFQEAGGAIYDLLNWQEITLDISDQDKSYMVVACRPDKLAEIRKYYQGE